MISSMEKEQTQNVKRRITSSNYCTGRNISGYFGMSGQRKPLKRWTLSSDLNGMKEDPCEHLEEEHVRRGNSRSKGPMVRAHLVGLRNSKRRRSDRR